VKKINTIKESDFTFWLFIVLITAFKIIFNFYTGLELYGDEAQYWLWSRNLDFGYYSKPPALPLAIWLSSQVCGQSEGCIRAPSAIFHFLSAIGIYLIGLQLYSKKIARLAVVAFITLPSVTLSSLLASTDPLLITAWTFAILFWLKALKNNHLQNWLLVGLFSGLGLLAKYNMAIFALAALIHLFATNKLKQLTNQKLWLAVLLAFVIFLPNLLWNYHNHFVSIIHTQDLAKGVGYSGGLMSLGTLLLGQFAVFHPILFVVLFFCANQKNYQSLMIFIATFLSVISLVALYSRAHMNWASPCYSIATLVTISYLVQKHMKRTLDVVFAINILLSISILIAAYISGHNKFHKYDPFVRLKGGKELANLINYYNHETDAHFATDNRMILSLLSYYLPGQPAVYKINDKDEIKDHFDLKMNAKQHKLEHVLYIRVNNKEAPSYEDSKYIDSIIDFPILGKRHSFTIYYIPKL
jgi:4-amino-4-deoxy-L-arabinose transferase-like glycosyltransferase